MIFIFAWLIYLKVQTNCPAKCKYENLRIPPFFSNFDSFTFHTNFKNLDPPLGALAWFFLVLCVGKCLAVSIVHASGNHPNPRPAPGSHLGVKVFFSLRARLLFCCPRYYVIYYIYYNLLSHLHNKLPARGRTCQLKRANWFEKHQRRQIRHSRNSIFITPNWGVTPRIIYTFLISQTCQTTSTPPC